MQVMVGTRNPSKVELFRSFLERYGVEVITPDAMQITDEPEETGRNPVENAAIKAAFYGRYADYAMADDAGLYFDPLPLEDPRQPGLHVRTPMGMHRLNDDEMVAYYARLIHELGGRVTAYYMAACALKTPDGIRTFMPDRDQARKNAFWMMDRQVSSSTPGWPLDSLSVFESDPFGAGEEASGEKRTAERTWKDFLVEALHLEPMEEA